MNAISMSCYCWIPRETGNWENSLNYREFTSFLMTFICTGGHCLALLYLHQNRFTGSHTDWHQGRVCQTGGTQTHSSNQGGNWMINPYKALSSLIRKHLSLSCLRGMVQPPHSTDGCYIRPLTGQTGSLYEYILISTNWLWYESGVGRIKQ